MKIINKKYYQDVHITIIDTCIVWAIIAININKTKIFLIFRKS